MMTDSFQAREALEMTINAFFAGLGEGCQRSATAPVSDNYLATGVRILLDISSDTDIKYVYLLAFRPQGGDRTLVFSATSRSWMEVGPSEYTRRSYHDSCWMTDGFQQVSRRGMEGEVRYRLHSAKRVTAEIGLRYDEQFRSDRECVVAFRDPSEGEG
tara:strand:- start:3002 stop:3475 length:474 start_codon:yes stop_codon:yes gene_type:complete